MRTTWRYPDRRTKAERLGTHLKNARGSYEEGEKKMDRLQSKVLSIEGGAEQLALPDAEE